MKKIVNDILKEEVYYEKLESGLEIFFMPKAGFSKKYAVFATKYGSNDLEFIPLGETTKFRVNEGIAHFLEHKMFEQPEDKNAFDRFSELGVSANAYTNFDITAYLFSCTQNFNEALAHLISYVQTPYFTHENVEKEKGIIEQEIKMYEDNADWKVYFNTLKAMYVNHPTRIDIAGTVESIYKITKEELYKCYNTFYNPANMAIFVVGDLDFEETIKVITDSVLKTKNEVGEIVRFYPDEPNHINIKEIKEDLPVSIPMFTIGFKDIQNDLEGRALLKKEILTEIILDMVFKRGSYLYEELYSGENINDTFGCDHVSQVGHGYTILSGESKDPLKTREIIMKALEKLFKDGLNIGDFERVKKRKIGMFLKSFDSVEFIANNFITYNFKGINLIEYLEVLKEVEFKEVEERFKSHFREELSVISIINPK